MTTWLTSFRPAYLSTCLDLLWRQWSAFGLPGQLSWRGRSALDPEALLLATVHFGRFDPRLFDASLDWWITHEQWLSTTRLRRLRKSLPVLDNRIFSAAADVVLESTSRRWRSLTTTQTNGNSLNVEVLFQQPTGKALPTVGIPDPIFKRHGLLRPRLERRRVSGKVPVETPAAVRIKLRALFGVSSRAEIVLFLMTNESGHSQQIAARTHYSQPSISIAMGQLAMSGLLTREQHRREVEYSLDREVWRRFLKLPGKIEWFDWSTAFHALREISVCLEGFTDKPISESLLGAELRKCAGSVNRLLSGSLINFRLDEGKPGELQGYAEVFAKSVGAFFQVLGVKMEL